MEFSWSALWNITDETPDNCEMFLNFNGMKLFLDCLKVVPPCSGGLQGHPCSHSSVQAAHQPNLSVAPLPVIPI